MSEPDSGSLTDLDPPPAETGRPDQSRPGRLVRRWAIEIVVIVGAAFALALVQQFIVKPFAIPSPSMEPTLMEVATVS